MNTRRRGLRRRKPPGAPITASGLRCNLRSVNLREIRALIRMKPFEPDSVRRRLSRCHDLNDLRRAALRRTPRPVFDYVDGGADDEVSMAGNRAAFERYRYVPRLGVDVSAPDLSTRIFDRPAAFPLALAPTGYTRMMHPAGERAVARAAARAGVPYTLSTMGTTTIEDVAATGHEDLWFQLYPWTEEHVSHDLVDRAAAAGYRVLAVTLDTAVSGRRSRDVRNGLIIPPALTLRTMAGIAIKPAYWARMLRSPAIDFANLTAAFEGKARDGAVANVSQYFVPGITWEFIAEMRRRWPGRLVVKGPVSGADAKRAVEAGVDGIHLSNHGGRQLDRSVAPLDLVPEVRGAVGEDVQVLIDSGIRHGADIATAVALGADAGVVGRAYLYGLMAAGEPGVDHALDLLRVQFQRTMQLLGVNSVAELRTLGPELLRPAP
ncbi:MAG: alpha-hydroxy-acid oxidizing enzyme [Streptosporangiales bacterium]|nr:alpha-hydroxy-acid oxidizing enzyme [Streptosporangiales bacterium]